MPIEYLARTLRRHTSAAAFVVVASVASVSVTADAGAHRSPQTAELVGERSPRFSDNRLAEPPPGPAAHRSRSADRADGAVPEGVTVFDDTLPALRKLDSALLRAVRRAATEARRNGVELYVNSGWRSAGYQQRLLDEARSKYGSRTEAARWVGTPATSSHVSGDAIDIGPPKAAKWLSEHGAVYNLCQIYENEPWHFELRAGAASRACPRRYPDPSHDPRMQQGRASDAERTTKPSQNAGAESSEPARPPLLPGTTLSSWRTWIGMYTGVALITLAALPLAALAAWTLARRRRRRGTSAARARRTAIADVGIVYGTLPWVWVTMLPGNNAGVVRGQVSLVPLRDLLTMPTPQIIGNLLIFAALGFLAPLRTRRLASLKRVVALAATGSVAIETTQYVLRLDRVSSVDDVLLNTAGAGLAALASRRWWLSVQPDLLRPPTSGDGVVTRT